MPVVEVHATHDVHAPNPGRREPLRPARGPARAPHGVIVQQCRATQIPDSPQVELTDQCWTRERGDSLGEQGNGDCSRNRAAADVHGDVDLVAVEIDRSGRGLDPQVEPRTAAHDAPQPGHQPARRERRGHANRHGPGRRLGLELSHASRDALECLAKLLGSDTSLPGQFHAPRGAVEQGYAEILLEAADLVADRGGRHVQFARRPSEARQPGGRLEGTQCGQRREGPRHL